MIGSRVRIGGVALLLGGLALMLAFVLTACNTVAGPKTVTVDEVGMINWVAFQDGSGAWQELTGTTFTVPDGAGKYGVAWECTSGSGQPTVKVLLATASESTGVTASCQGILATYVYTVTGTVLGIPSGGTAFVAIGSRYAVVTASNPNFTLSGVPAGVQTAVAYALYNGGAPYAMVMVRNATISGDTTWTPDVSTGWAFTLNTFDVTGTPGGETPGLSANLVTSGSAGPTILGSTTGTTVSYPELPVAFSQPTDTYILDGGALATGVAQAAVVKSQSPTNGATLQLPSALSLSAGIGVTTSTATATWGSATFATSGGLKFFFASLTPSTITSPAWVVIATGGWMGTATSYTFPDFSATSGWNTSWNFPTGQSATAAMFVYHTNATVSQFATFLHSNEDYTTLPNGADLELTARAATGTY